MIWLLALLLILAAPAGAREVWADRGFVAYTCGQMNKFPEWTGIKMDVTMPANSYILLDAPGALMLRFPCKGWVADIGIVAIHGCTQLAADTRERSVVYTEQDICEDRTVRMIVMVPKMNIREDCRPDSLKWVQSKGRCYAEEDPFDAGAGSGADSRGGVSSW